MLIEILRLFARILEPPLLLLILVLAGLIATLSRRWLTASLLQALAFAIFVFVGVLPGGAWLASPLEHRFPPNPPLPAQVAGIITLGGTERVAQSATSGQPVFSDTTPILALIELGRQHPEAKMVFTGGMHPRDKASPTEADIVRQFFRAIGADDSRVVYETRSRTTMENARFSRDLLHPSASERWILVTQAVSMPRAVAVFRNAGWNVIPYPVGYFSHDNQRLRVSLDLLGELRLASLALHEWGGLVAYRLMGYTDTLFPK
jgi:uncharacterized SAM-binding protein YcdF (DUF218 family)